ADDLAASEDDVKRRADALDASLRQGDEVPPSIVVASLPRDQPQLLETFQHPRNGRATQTEALDESDLVGLVSEGAHPARRRVNQVEDVESRGGHVRHDLQ